MNKSRTCIYISVQVFLVSQDKIKSLSGKLVVSIWFYFILLIISVYNMNCIYMNWNWDKAKYISIIFSNNILVWDIVWCNIYLLLGRGCNDYLVRSNIVCKYTLDYFLTFLYLSLFHIYIYTKHGPAQVLHLVKVKHFIEEYQSKFTTNHLIVHWIKL